MATASSELDVIDSNPVKKALGTFQRLFESTRADLGVADSSDAVQVVFSTATVVAKNLLLDLILTLQNETMSDLFETQNDVSQADCETYAEKLVKGPLTAALWQGHHSYTLISASGLVVQFRSSASPLDVSATALAKATHGRIAPTTAYHGQMPHSSVSVWVMEKIPGTGYLFTIGEITKTKQEAIVVDLAKFYAESWKKPQPQDRERFHQYNAKLEQLSKTLPVRFKIIIERIQGAINQITEAVPWVLTHTDLSDMNILVDPNSGHLTGVVDWADAGTEPFGIALWGLESVLGYSGDHGWAYFFPEHILYYRSLFYKTFMAEIGEVISDTTGQMIEDTRILGILLRYGFIWEDGIKQPAKDVALLDLFCKSHFVNSCGASEEAALLGDHTSQ